MKMKNPRTMIQEWDTIKHHADTRPESCSPDDDVGNDRDRNDDHDGGHCRSCTCADCLQCCSRCASKSMRSCSACCRGCVSCMKGLRRQGWKKWCLFSIVFILLIMVILNLALTLWLMKIMEFSHTGMGPLRIVSNGVELSGKAYVLDDLVASSIKSRSDKPLVLESYDNFTIKAADADGKLENIVFFDNETFTCRSKNLVIEDHEGNILFSSSLDQLVIGAHELKVAGEGGITFDKSVVVPKIESPTGKSLSIQSLTRSMELSSAGEMFVQSKAGGIHATTLKDISFTSRNGTVQIKSHKIFMPNLTIARISTRHKKRSKYKYHMYQVCVCENGRLFLAKASGTCEMYDVAFLCKKNH